MVDWPVLSAFRETWKQASLPWIALGVLAAGFLQLAIGVYLEPPPPGPSDLHLHYQVGPIRVPVWRLPSTEGEMPPPRLCWTIVAALLWGSQWVLPGHLGSRLAVDRVRMVCAGEELRGPLGLGGVVSNRLLVPFLPYMLFAVIVALGDYGWYAAALRELPGEPDPSLGWWTSRYAQVYFRAGATSSGLQLLLAPLTWLAGWLLLVHAGSLPGRCPTAWCYAAMVVDGLLLALAIPALLVQFTFRQPAEAAYATATVPLFVRTALVQAVVCLRRYLIKSASRA